MAENPVLCETTRGGVVESRHTGAVVAIDARGRVVFALGDVDRPVFPRSAVKAIQALPLIESGAADGFGFGAKELALACSSHSGEEGHADLAAAMLAKAGRDEATLECGAHWPLSIEAAGKLSFDHKRPTPLHNNCSGKHAGFVCTCVALEDDAAGYVGKDHAAMERVRRAMEEVTGAVHDPAAAGIDGCSIPTYAVPLTALAQGFARMATGEGFTAPRKRAAERLISACMAEPWLVAGTGRFDTEIMQALPRQVFAKTGAEGVYCAALPALGVGVALKIDDGAGRAAEVAVAAALAKVLRAGEKAEKLRELAVRPFVNWNGIRVGEARPGEAFS
ncbi:MAG: asparaginase [Phyllobacteriaceae bacterium]|nr:asparaginase [Phyllobacteriaceae bacterium]